MLNRTTTTDIASTRARLRDVGGRVATASTHLELERALREYVELGVQLHDHLTEESRTLMRTSLPRKPALRDFASYLSAMSEMVLAKSVGSSKA